MISRIKIFRKILNKGLEYLNNLENEEIRKLKDKFSNNLGIPEVKGKCLELRISNKYGISSYLCLDESLLKLIIFDNEGFMVKYINDLPINKVLLRS